MGGGGVVGVLEAAESPPPPPGTCQPPPTWNHGRPWSDPLAPTRLNIIVAALLFVSSLWIADPRNTGGPCMLWVSLSLTPCGGGGEAGIPSPLPVRRPPSPREGVTETHGCLIPYSTRYYGRAVFGTQIMAESRGPSPLPPPVPPSPGTAPVPTNTAPVHGGAPPPGMNHLTVTHLRAKGPLAYHRASRNVSPSSWYPAMCGVAGNKSHKQLANRRSREPGISYNPT